jgi:hypothetical protein
MSATTQQFEPAIVPTSPLILSDRLLTLAEAAERAGFAHTADDLVRLAHRVFDEKRREDA